MHTNRALFFGKPEHFFLFSKKGRGDFLPPPPASCAPDFEQLIPNIISLKAVRYEGRDPLWMNQK